jgi:ferredoxin-NADP reductase
LTDSSETLFFRDFEQISELYIKYSFEVKNAEGFHFIPGQYLDLVFNNGGNPERRSYSIASNPKEGIITLVIKNIKQGLAASVLGNLKQGDSIPFYGPYGNLNVSDLENHSYLLIASGSGVAPFRSMLYDIQNDINSQNKDINLLVTGASMQDIPFLDEFLETANTTPNFKTHIYCLDESIEKGGEYLNNVFDRKLLQILEVSKPDKVLISSNPGLVQRTRNLLVELGFSNSKILSDI